MKMVLCCKNKPHLVTSHEYILAACELFSRPLYLWQSFFVAYTISPTKLRCGDFFKGRVVVCRFWSKPYKLQDSSTNKKDNKKEQKRIPRIYLRIYLLFLYFVPRVPLGRGEHTSLFTKIDFNSRTFRYTLPMLRPLCTDALTLTCLYTHICYAYTYTY